MMSFHRKLDDDIFNQLMTTGFTPDFVCGNEPPKFGPKIKLDLAETKKGFEATFEMPGVKKEDVKLSFKDNVLTVATETTEETEGDDEDKKYHWKERKYGSMQRSITFPKQVDTNNAKASYDHGILKVTVPKAEDHKVSYIKID